MSLYLTLTIVTVMIACFVSREQPERVDRNQNMRFATRQQMSDRVLVFSVFLLLFAVSFCRVAVGHDYWEYKNIFYLIHDGRANDVATESGFNLLVIISGLLFGNDNYIAVFGIIALPTVALSVKALYDQSESFAASFFLYMMFGYYFQSFNTVRYYLVLAVAMYAMKHVIQKDYARFMLWIVAAAFFHKAVLLVIPIYLVCAMPWKKWFYIVLAAFCVTLLVFPGFYREIIFTIYPAYENSIYDTGETSYINIARCASVLVFSLVYYKTTIHNSVANLFYFKLNLAALLVFCCCSFMPVVSRVGYFMNIAQLFLIPGVVLNIKDKKMRIIWGSLIIVASIGYFALYLWQAAGDGIRIIPYLNWIFN